MSGAEACAASASDAQAPLRRRRVREPGDDQVALDPELRRHARAEFLEPSRMLRELAAPGFLVDGDELLEGFARHGAIRPIDVVVSRHPTELRLAAHGSAPNASNDPREDALVV